MLIPLHVSYVNGKPLRLLRDSNHLVIQTPVSDQTDVWLWNEQEHSLSLTSSAMNLDALYAALEFVFNSHPEIPHVNIQATHNQFDILLALGLAQTSGKQLCIRKEIFWQNPALWLNAQNGAPYPQKYLITNQIRHPSRPPHKNGLLYQRFIPWLNQTLSFRALDIEKDLNHFHRWMNDPRVAYFWQEEGSKEQHVKYLEKSAADSHSQSVIGCFDEQPFAYFEIYWAKEDRISPFYDAGDYDRGWHLLVGEEAFRGRQWFSAWFPSLQHYLFLDDPRTQRIVAEPRHDNERLINHAQTLGFANLKSFDFPHKRAQLLMLSRERFFEEHRWQPRT